MKIFTEDLRDFSPWAGAVDTWKKIEEAGKLDALENFIDECFPDGISFTSLNDLLWFEPEYVFEAIGIESDEEEDFND